MSDELSRGPVERLVRRQREEQRMSIHTEALRDIAANHGWPVCDEVADELEGHEKAYDLLFAENGELRDEIDRLHDLLLSIGNIAHNGSTGPAVPDLLWEIRGLAYGAL